ncbi:hypothetical protein AURDEDRAFT_160784 [Auricularia subglabra TFB-10046 SS5]|nr:hypothetical protein AURDEDRAFT_160784 [Auricularia subglabra TFB-10046 SS5]
MIRSSLAALLSRAERLDLPALVVPRVLPLITAHVEHFRKSEVALRGNGLERHLTHLEELDLLFGSRYPGRGTPPWATSQSQITRHAPAPRIEFPPDKSVPANLEFLISSPVVDDSERCLLFPEPPESWEEMQTRRMEAISAALEDIIAEDKPGSREEQLSISSRWRTKTRRAAQRAELMGNDTELHLLPKSQSALAGELHAREVQKTKQQDPHVEHVASYEATCVFLSVPSEVPQEAQDGAHACVDFGTLPETADHGGEVIKNHQGHMTDLANDPGVDHGHGNGAEERGTNVNRKSTGRRQRLTIINNFNGSRQRIIIKQVGKA